MSDQKSQEELMAMLREANPRWVHDGLGIRGPDNIPIAQSEQVGFEPMRISESLELPNSDIFPEEVYQDDQIGGGGGAALRPFELVAVKDESDNNRIRVMASTIDGETPTGFSAGDDPHFLLTPATSGVVYGKIVIVDADAERDGTVPPEVLLADTKPADTDTDKHVKIGTYSVSDGVLTVSNDRYGPIVVVVCRKWFVSEAPFSGVTFQ